MKPVTLAITAVAAAAAVAFGATSVLGQDDPSEPSGGAVPAFSRLAGLPVDAAASKRFAAFQAANGGGGSTDLKRAAAADGGDVYASSAADQACLVIRRTDHTGNSTCERTSDAVDPNKMMVTVTPRPGGNVEVVALVPDGAATPTIVDASGAAQPMTLSGNVAVAVVASSAKAVRFGAPPTDHPISTAR